MNKKIIVIGVLTLLIAVAFPATNAMNVEENEVLPNALWIRFGFFRGEITDIKEEYYNDKLFYNCTAVDVKITWFTYTFPLNFTIESVSLIDTDFFVIRDTSFIGILREGLLFGIVYNAGMWNKLSLRLYEYHIQTILFISSFYPVNMLLLLLAYIIFNQGLDRDIRKNTLSSNNGFD